MASILVARDDDEREALIGWWQEGESLGPETTVTCGADEVVLFVDGDEIVAELGPGRHRLTKETQPALSSYLVEGAPEIDVAFVKTGNVTLAVHGVVGEFKDEETEIEYEISITSSFRAKVSDPALALALFDELDDDVTVEDFLIDTFLDAAADALGELEPTLAAFRASGGKLAGFGEATLSRVREELDDSGVEIELAEDLVAALDDDGGDDDDDSPE